MARARSSLQAIWERENIDKVTTGVDLWRGTADALPVPDQTTWEQMTLVSTNAADDDGGTGINTVYIHYLDVNWEQQNETVILDGENPVNTIATDIKFVQDIHAVTVGSSGVAVWNITIYQTGDDTIVYDMIEAWGNMSLTISKMVPANKTFFLTRWTASATWAGKPIFLRIRSTDHHKVLYNWGNPTFIFKDTVTLEWWGTFVREWDTDERIQIPAKSIIKISAWAVQSWANVAGSFEWELIDKT